jgi:hypothetical protein
MGAAMGFTPDQVRAMSLYDFSACVTGYRRANGVDNDGALTVQDEERLAAAIDVRRLSH